MSTVKMNKHDFWLQQFADNKKLIVSFIVIFGGMITRESFYLLKQSGVSKFKQFMARTVITFFICLIAHSLTIEWSANAQMALLASLSLSCILVLDWFLNKAVPSILSALKRAGIKWITGIADKYKQGEGER